MLHMADGMGWWMIWGGLMMVVFWGTILALIVWAVQAATRREVGQVALPQPATRRRAPLEIIGERYARGEISREEFEQLRRDLEEA